MESKNKHDASCRRWPTDTTAPHQQKHTHGQWPLQAPWRFLRQRNCKRNRRQTRVEEKPGVRGEGIEGRPWQITPQKRGCSLHQLRTRQGSNADAKKLLAVDQSARWLAGGPGPKRDQERREERAEKANKGREHRGEWENTGGKYGHHQDDEDRRRLPFASMPAAAGGSLREAVQSPFLQVQ